MTVPVHRKITGWVFDHLLWDTTGAAAQGFRGVMWAIRKPLIALVGSGVLTWREWVEHHPPEIAIVAVIHFVFVLAVIAIGTYFWQWIRVTPER